MADQIPIITYTNSKCSDLWRIYIDLLHKYYGVFHNTILSDYSEKFIYDGTEYFTYDNNDPFYDVWIRYLSKFKNEYFIYMQEDFFLYNNVDKEKLIHYFQFMNENKDVSCIRLLKSGIRSNLPLEGQPTLFYINYNTDYAFSMQPSIWRTNDFLTLQKSKVHITPWDEGKLNKDILSKLNLISLYHYDNEPMRGIDHYDSTVFPYIATALVKGKWNIKEYPELMPILNQYNIDTYKRGEYR